eukprot:CAMPEP_0170734800 /NCGR_PEP_ID=MMETSP0437-20130122/2776_1 /TAXON_ID=0 /ORGANISM="Sexangularia sp." /LENGTH=364 /DNA_ID=CAMNT_0011073123 /DNA_START=80 /DNA_END=1174 /DNA_ORIENTATION=-
MGGIISRIFGRKNELDKMEEEFARLAEDVSSRVEFETKLTAARHAWVSRLFFFTLLSVPLHAFFVYKGIMGDPATLGIHLLCMWLATRFCAAYYGWRLGRVRSAGLQLRNQIAEHLDEFKRANQDLERKLRLIKNAEAMVRQLSTPSTPPPSAPSSARSTPAKRAGGRGAGRTPTRGARADATPASPRQSSPPQSVVPVTPGQAPARRQPVTPAAAAAATPAAQPQQTPNPFGTRVPTVRAAARRVVQPSELPNTPNTWLDSVVEFIIGDGPRHGVALICDRCGAHNGTQHPSESRNFRCGNCNAINAEQPRVRRTADEASKPVDGGAVAAASDSDEQDHEHSTSGVLIAGGSEDSASEDKKDR